MTTPTTNIPLTVRDALRQPLPELEYQPSIYGFHHVRTAIPGSTGTIGTANRLPFTPSGEQTEWSEFRRDLLSRLFKYELGRPYRGPSVAPALGEDCLVGSIDSVACIYGKFVWPVINNALYDQHSKPFYSVGSRFHQSVPFVCVGGVTDRVPYLAGDCNIRSPDSRPPSKHSSHHITRSHSADEKKPMVDTMDNSPEWQAMHNQLKLFAATKQTRYGFSISDKGVYVYRFHLDKEHSPSALLSSAKMRYTPGAHSQQPPQIRTEYCWTPWHADTADLNAFTPKEALFFLALMAVNGRHELAEEYPALDSYEPNAHSIYARRRNSISSNTSGSSSFPLRSYMHNTSGHYAEKSDNSNTYREIPGFYHNGITTKATVDRLTRVRNAGSKGVNDVGQDQRPPQPNAGLELMPRVEPVPEQQSPKPDPGSDAEPDTKVAPQEDMVDAGQVSPSTVDKTWVECDIHAHKKGGGLYFYSVNRRYINTDISQWKQMGVNIHTLVRRDIVYYTKGFSK